MKDKKLQVFVSSTYTDLIEERQAAVEAILSSGHIPAGMELFSAGDESQMEVIKRWIDESDIYLLILSGRYGSIDKESGKSYTHLEYEYAVKQDKPFFAVVINEDALDLKSKSNPRQFLELENPKELKQFREIVLKKMVKFWNDKKDIKIAIHETISEFSYSKKLIGWIRGDNTIDANLIAEQIAKLTSENAELRSKVERNKNDLANYYGLTFIEMKKLLNDVIIEWQEGYTLYQYLIDNGFQLTVRQKVEFNNKNTINILRQYGLVEIQIEYVQSAMTPTLKHSIDWYKFTDEGHKFYLRALLQESSVSEG